MAVTVSMAHPAVDAAWHRSSEVGVRMRSPKLGVEEDLISDFLEDFQMKIPRGTIATVFREPWLECGCPDIVIVIWKPNLTKTWCSAREPLSNEDFKILQYLHWTDTNDFDSIISRFGNRASKSISKLVDANLVLRQKKGLKPRTLNISFAIERILAVEAKVSSWRSALDQAIRNHWFATDSCVLWPTSAQSNAFECAATEADVDILTLDEPEYNFQDKSVLRYPKSYASWQFNEWVWRRHLISNEYNTEVAHDES